MTYRKWFALNQDRLESKYEDYFENVDKEIDVPMSYEEFVMNEWDSFDGYCEREERE